MRGRVKVRERDRRIMFERPIARQSAMGREPAKHFKLIGQRWAKVLYGTGAERREAGAENATQAATFIVTNDEVTRAVTVRDRIWFDGRGWDITSAAPIAGDRHFTAVVSKE